MDNIQVSLVASANRHTLANGFKNWERLINSLKSNTINYEVIFVGDSPCPYPMPKEFKWIKATVKPSQCYQIGFWASKGELVGWTADDADYIHQGNIDNLDRAYFAYKRVEEQYKDNKTIIAMRPVEGGNPDVQELWHYLFGGCPWSPRMAPFGLINREFFLNDMKGYPNDHISGQTENSVVMSAYQLGGRVIFQKDAWVVVHHHHVHPRNNQGKEINYFRDWYPDDRKALENRWVKEGYGNYEKLTTEQLQNVVHISKTPLVPITPFVNSDDVCSVTQGPKGKW